MDVCSHTTHTQLSRVAARARRRRPRYAVERQRASRRDARASEGETHTDFFRVVFQKAKQNREQYQPTPITEPSPHQTPVLSGAPRPCIPWLARSASCFGSRLNHGYKRRARTYDASAAWAFAPPMPRDEMSQLANSVSSSGHVPIQSQTQLSCGQFCIAQFCTHHASE